MHYPRILVATAICIGNGLDLDDFYCVVYIGFSTSIINCVQEMGRRGRRNANPVDSKDQFDIFANLQDFVNFNQGLYQDMKDASKDKNRIIPCKISQNMNALSS